MASKSTVSGSLWHMLAGLNGRMLRCRQGTSTVDKKFALHMADTDSVSSTPWPYKHSDSCAQSQE